MTNSYFVFSESHQPVAPIPGGGPVVCRICRELGIVDGETVGSLPSEPTPIDVPEPPIEPPDGPDPLPELFAAS